MMRGGGPASRRRSHVLCHRDAAAESVSCRLACVRQTQRYGGDAVNLTNLTRQMEGFPDQV